MTAKESSIINGDSPLPIPRQFARWLGWNEAGILQQLHYHTEQEHGQVLDGLRWIRMSETDWMEEIPLDEKAIQRAIVNLGSDGLIMSRTFKGRCKWYAILYSAVSDLAGPVKRITQKSAKRKLASASRKEFIPKEQNVPIVINSIDAGSSGDYANPKEQSVPIIKEQNGPMDRNKMGGVWEQNVPLQESLQESRQDTTPNGVVGKPTSRPKTTVKESFENLTGLKMPTAKTEEKAWWGWYGQILGIGGDDPDRSVEIMTLAVEYMDDEGLTINKPKSIIDFCRAVAAGRPLVHKGQNGQAARASPQRPLDTEKAARYREIEAARQKD